LFGLCFLISIHTCDLRYMPNYSVVELSGPVVKKVGLWSTLESVVSVLALVWYMFMDLMKHVSTCLSDRVKLTVDRVCSSSVTVVESALCFEFSFFQYQEFLLMTASIYYQFYSYVIPPKSWAFNSWWKRFIRKIKNWIIHYFFINNTFWFN